MGPSPFRPLLAAGLLVLGIVAGAGPAAGVEPSTMDEAPLRAALLPTDNAGLIQFLRLRAQGEPDQGTLAQLIEKLHAEAPAVRQQACADLVAIGTPALPLLRAAAREPDALAASLAQRCLKSIETDNGRLPLAAVRLLAQRRPAGAAEALLAYLPHARSEVDLEEVQEALYAVTYDGKGVADAGVVKALGDKHPLRRATAIAALAQGNLAPYRDPARKLLQDPAPSVRLRAALALAEAHELEAIPTLVALLDDLTDAPARQAVEEYLTDLAGGRGPKTVPGTDEKTRRQAREAWAKWWRDAETLDLLDELTRRTVRDADRDKALPLIAKLGDDDFQVREAAERDLIQLGVPILPLLKVETQKNLDAEVRQRAERCLAALGMAKEEDKSFLPSIARLIALRKPAGAAEIILAYLPSVDEDGLLDKLQNTLIAVAFSDGKPQPVLAKSLTDKVGIRRAAAAAALCAAPGGDHLPVIRPLLQDPEPAVRLKVAQALAGARDRTAVPILIALVAELPSEQALQVEEFLSLLTGEAGPPNLPEGAENARKRSAAWSAWWDTHKDSVVLVPPNLRERFEPDTKAIAPCPPNLLALQGQIGKTFRFKVTGAAAGALWGTDVYTTDSSIAAAAVHAGVLKVGKTGVVKVKIVAPPPQFQGSTRNGVVSAPWGPFTGAFKVSR
jgi:HEAT repeat protein